MKFPYIHVLVCTLFPYTTLFRSEERRVGKECTLP